MVVGEMAQQADVIIIGGGPGGYHAAIRSAQLGRQVILIEKEELGGVCLNIGCIPSKVLTRASSKWHEFKKSSEYGIEAEHLQFNYKKLLDYQRKTIDSLRAGVEALCKANKIQVIKGQAFFLSEDKVGVEEGEKYEVLQFKNAVIAAGVRPIPFQKFANGNRRIVNSWSISSLSEVPGHLAVVGSDATSLEMAMSYRALGSEVTVILDSNKKDFGFDSSINRELTRLFKKERITLLKGYSLEEAETNDEKVKITLLSGEETKKMEATHLFIQGRLSANTSELGLDRLGMKMTSDGFILVDNQCRTSVAGIFSVGDINGAPFLASKALKEGKVAAEAMSGLNSETDFRFMPTILHTRPPIAAAGLTEEQARELGVEFKISQFPLASNGFAGISGEKDGLVKVISDKETEMILGVHIIGIGALELIAGGVTALEMAAREEDLAFPIYAHPGIAEALLEAVEGLSGKAVHLKPAKKPDTEVPALKG